MADVVTLNLTPGAAAADAASGSILFIGNATVLIRYAGFTILTDPTFIHMHESVSIGYGMHSRRLTNPAMDIEQLPALDFVLLSHFHGDHFDQVAERSLDHALPIITTGEACKALAERGFTHAHEVACWSSALVRKGGHAVRITSMPGRHGPPMSELVMPEVMGSMLEFMDAGEAVLFRLYITGDTLIFDDLEDIPRRYPDIDLALLHLGGTRVLGILVTMDAEQGVQCLQLMRPQRAIPIHFNDYDVFKSPLDDFKRAVDAAGWADRVQYLNHGDSYVFQRRV
jgi:L-ascorbate metabolism protein UlaG (beta-lactamase superfamily)